MAVIAASYMRNAVERSHRASLSEAAVSFSCRIPRRFGNHRDKGIDLRVHSLDLTQDRFRDL